ncbi:trypsin-like peptidase domain-containing protein [Candidatus Berkelbacteria bacterium]|nr:trypsin-like peptidase domain-containing protein [Candidatus Berkelbacteria bacterium]
MLTSPLSSSPSGRRPGRGAFVILFLFLALFMGALGAIGGLWLVATTDLGDRLGLGEGQVLDLGVTKTERLVLEESSAVIDASETVSLAVVSISTTRNVLDFFGRTVEQTGGGTGFILTSDGLIVTNKHVVADEATYTVFTSDGRDFPATVLARDPLNDLAVLKVEASGLPVVELGSSAELRIGQYVIAIGNALGEFSNTVTLGVVSAKERQIVASGGGGISESLSGLIQTDAAINPGNSGGPLVNLAGQVVGINTAVAGGAENIGFAIPIDVIKRAIDSVRETGQIKRPMLGIRYVPITKELARSNQLPSDHGAWVLPGDTRAEVAVIPGSPADRAGIKENDIVTAMDGKLIDENHPLLSRLAEYVPGDTVTLTVLSGGQERQVDVTLDELES